MRLLSGSFAPFATRSWISRSCSADDTWTGSFGATRGTTDESQVFWTAHPFVVTMLGGAGDPELKSRIWGLFLPRCLALTGRRDARPGGGTRTLLPHRSEVLHEP